MDEDEFEEHLDDIYGEIEVCGYTYPAGRALKELDPIAFRCGLSEMPARYVCECCGEEFEDPDEAVEHEKECEEENEEVIP